MQKINTLLIVLLLAAVAFLFSRTLSSPEETNAPVAEEIEPKGEEDSPLAGEGKVAYINIDSINDGFQFLKDKLELLQDKQSRSERQMANKMQKAQSEFEKLQEEAKYMTQRQLEEAQRNLQDKEVELQAYQERLAGDLIRMENEIQLELHERLMAAVDSINSVYGYDYVLAKSAGGGILIGKESYELTHEVLNLMNKNYGAGLAKDQE